MIGIGMAHSVVFGDGSSCWLDPVFGCIEQQDSCLRILYPPLQFSPPPPSPTPQKLESLPSGRRFTTSNTRRQFSQDPYAGILLCQIAGEDSGGFSGILGDSFRLGFIFVCFCCWHAQLLALNQSNFTLGLFVRDPPTA